MFNFDTKTVLAALKKAVDANVLDNLVPEDLEREAHLTLWGETEPYELTLLRMIPTVKATNVQHEYTKVTSYGYERNTGFFGEKSLPPETEFDTERVVTQIKLMGEIAPTFILAAMEETQRVDGQKGAVNIARRLLRLNVLRKMNRNLYFSDTSTHKLGANGTRYAGIEQLIREGTDGTTGEESPYGTHVIDMEGEPLTPETIRSKAARALSLFGMFNQLIMDPFVRADFEGQLDPAQRLGLPIPVQPFMIGQMIGGLQTQGTRIYFHTDNALSPIHYIGQYTTRLVHGAPSTVPSVGGSAGSVGGTRTSKFFAKDAGNYAYIVTEIVDEREGLGTRWPTGSSFQAVAANEEVTLTVTPGNPSAHTLRVYRGTTGDADTDFQWLGDFAVSTTGVGTTTIYDGNHDRPGTSKAYGLRITTAAEKALNSGLLNAYASAREKSKSFLKMKDDEARNTVSLACLGPKMGIMKLASILAEVDRPLMYSACAPQVRNPYQNIVFKNIGALNA